MNAPETLSRWNTPGSSRVPFWAYTDAQLYQRELEKFFYGNHWCYVGLAVEIPNTGDFKLSFVGERQVIMVRDRVAPKERDTDHGIRVVENRCAHRGVRFCQRHRHHHALAGGQAVGLDDDGRAQAVNEGVGGSRVGKGVVVGRGNAVAAHEGLAERLGAFQLRRSLGGAEDAQAALAEQVDDTGVQPAAISGVHWSAV